MGNPALKIKDDLVGEVSQLINKRTGIQLGPKQMAMVESRLKRRLYELGLDDFAQYREYLDSHRDSEVEALVSLITTHHTFFFREFVQFEYLESQLATLVANARKRGVKKLRIYSAACSRGQEVYSLAMHLDRHLKLHAPDFDFEIFGSDVDPESVGVAANGVYRREEIKTVPLFYQGSHWAKGTGEIAEFVKAKKSIRSRCEFATVNLFDLKAVEAQMFDVIFCRNVFIYFTADQIKTITANLVKRLHPGGLLFVGVSESLHSLGLGIRGVGPSVYASTSDPMPTKAANDPVAAAAPVATTVAMPLPNPLRVVCVDDSSSILVLLKKILGKDQGFSVVATAGNGKEAVEIIRKEKPHLVTLDIHMPVCTGIEYLQNTKGPDRPPIVMVTSVSRDDASLAWKALSLGAADYVEKPALNNLEERAEEIRAKLRSAFRARAAGVSSKALDKKFARAKDISDPQSCAVIFSFGVGDFEKCSKVFKEVSTLKVPVYFAVEGADAILPSLAERLAKESGAAVQLGFSGSAGVGGLREAVEAAKARKHISVLVFGEVSGHGAESILSLSGAQLVLEDQGEGKGCAALSDVASDIVLPTSFAYLAQEYLAQKTKKKS